MNTAALQACARLETKRHRRERTNYAIALHAAALGFSVLPLYDNKRPAVKWKRLQTERATAAELAEWFVDNDYTPGIITGEMSGIVAVDIDHVDALDAYLDGPNVESDVMQRTPRGWHYIYTHPGERTPNRQRVGGAMLDVRGDGGYVVAYDDVLRWTALGVATGPVYSAPRLCEYA